MKEITASDLKTRLESGEALAVVDIREPGEFSNWHISGSENLPVYDALRAGSEDSLLAGAAALPRDQPVVMVCRAGLLSRKASDVLESLGFDAYSLSGGIRGWGAVWTVAPIDRLDPQRGQLWQLRRNGKGCLSYLLGVGQEAAVFDPCVEIEAYLELADLHGRTIRHVFETHVHADHLSRARELCRATGARHRLRTNPRVTYEYDALEDGDATDVGGLPVVTVATPGHTSESVCFVIDGKIILTGDTLFVNSVGRPDLERDDDGAEDGARMLFRSLHDRLIGDYRDAWIYPAHYSDAIGFDQQPIGSSMQEVRRRDLLGVDEATFVDSILGSLKAKPSNYETIMAVNEGKQSLGEIDPLDLEAGPNRCAAG